MADRDCNKTYLLALSSSSKSSWWKFHHQPTCPTTSTSTSSWNVTASSPLVAWENYDNPKSSPCDHEDASLSASKHSNLTVDELFNRFVEPSSSSNNIITEPTDYNSQLWSQLRLSVEERQKMQGEVRDEEGENLLKAISLKNFSHGKLEPLAYSDYLQKFDTRQHVKWVDNNGDQYPYSGTNNFFHNYPANSRLLDPPDQSPMVHQLFSHPCNDIPPIDPSDHPKQKLAYQQQLCMGTGGGNSGFDRYSYVFDHTRPENYHREENDRADPSLGALFPRESNIHNRNGFTPTSLPNSLSLLESRKHQRTTLQGRGQAASTNEGKKRRPDDTHQSSNGLKKFKHECGSSSPSTASSSAKARDTTHQSPKVKIAAEKISALQRIVSPFGKTDTASVLQEAIGFIKCHQEQVQLLSNHYLKSSVNKQQEAWRGMDMKVVKGEGIINKQVLDLKSRGLCLVPTSNIPQVYMDSAGPDYWPAYRGCMFR